MLKAKPIELIGLTKRFGHDVVAVDGFDLSIPGGEFLTLLGPSGCGKTTLLRMIAGLEQVSSGKIMLDSEDITDVPPNKRDTSIMFQDYALFPHKTIIENIGFGLKMSGLSKTEYRKRAQEMLDFIQLPDVGRRVPSQLSGGQKQRVALARSLVIEPAVLLLDEPLGALDANLRRRMQVELKRVQREVGITFIYVTHDQEEALSMSDRIVVMRDGKAEQIGTPTEIYREPRTEFVATFIGQCNVLEATVEEVSNNQIICAQDGFGRLKAVNPSRFPVNVGKTVKLAVRPENISIGAAAKGKENRAKVQISDHIFVGSTSRCIVSLDNGIEINVEGPGIAELGNIKQVQIGWSADDSLVLSEGQE